jgi:ADP-ribosylglycohydrolase
MTQDMLKDKVRGCLMAGAAGDALGYEVEFINRRTILSRFGERGITTFELDR